MTPRKNQNFISIRGARLHNLRGINLDIPKGRLVAITGVSGSGKSTLAFDLLFEEGRKRYMQSLGYAPRVEEDDHFDSLAGLPPTIAVAQRTLRLSNPRSVVGTRTRVYDLLRHLFAIAGRHPCPKCGGKMGQDGQCTTCHQDVARLPAGAFAFNSPEGMCLQCFGRGYVTEFQESLLVVDTSLPLPAALNQWVRPMVREALPALAQEHGFTLTTPYGQFSPEARHALINGSSRCRFEGLAPLVKRTIHSRPNGTTDRNNKVRMERAFCGRSTCPRCGGYRIAEESLAVTVGGRNIGELASMNIASLARFLETEAFKAALGHQARRLAKGISSHLQLLCDVGLPHLTLLRETPSLSGGEQTRLFFVAHIDCGLDGVAYIFDEPSVGLHELEKKSLISRLKALVNQGHSVLLVEHDRTMIAAADHVIDIGPGGGKEGGTIVYQGGYDGLLRSRASVTGKHLSGRSAPPRKLPPHPITAQTPCLSLHGARTHNLKDLTVWFPLGVMVGVAGVSGSGKSSLVSDTLVPLLRERLASESFDDEAATVENLPSSAQTTTLDGWRSLKRCAVVTQAPIGRNRTSTPATYIGVWDAIRAAFARQKSAGKETFTAGHFSYNSEKGACPVCNGEGWQYIPTGGWAMFPVMCPQCRGRRFREDVLGVTFQGRNIVEVLQGSFGDAAKTFSGEKTIAAMLEVVERVGLGYLTLGQPATTLSGGEAQRLKLAKELGRARQPGTPAPGTSGTPGTPGTLYILDEPTTGLSCADVAGLATLLDELVQQGNSVIVVEHDPELLSLCDHIIELGPGGAEEGGRLVAVGSPAQLRAHKASRIGPFLKDSP